MSTQKHPDFPNFHVVTHPLISHKLSVLRDKSTTKKTFKELIDEVTLLLAYEATSQLELVDKVIETPLETMHTRMLATEDPVILPILRAGIGMVDAFLSLIPTACVGHIGIYRDESTLEPHQYYFKIPKGHESRTFFVCDPMLATGGTTVATMQKLRERGVKNIVFVCIVAAPEGARHLQEAFPDIPVYTASLDRELNSHGYILPGLGDAGDRIFGTQ